MSSISEGEAGFTNPEIDPSLFRERLVAGERLLDQGDFVDAFSELKDVYDSDEKATLTKGRAARGVARAASKLYNPAHTWSEHWQNDTVTYADAAFAIHNEIVESLGAAPTAESLKERAASATSVGNIALKQCVQLELNHPLFTVKTEIPYIKLAQDDIARATDMEKDSGSDQYAIDALQTWSLYESLHGDRTKGQAFALKALRTAHKTERGNANLNFMQKKRAQARYLVGALAALQVNVLASHAENHPSFRRRALELAKKSL